MRPRGQPLAGAEGVETETAQTPRSVRGSSVGAITSNTTSSKGEYSPVRQSSGNGWSPATPRMVASTPPSSVRNSPRQTSSGGAQNRGGVSKAPGSGFGTAPSSGGPGRTPQTRRKEFSLQQGSSDNRYTSPSGSPRASTAPRVTNNTTSNSGTCNPLHLSNKYVRVAFRDQFKFRASFQPPTFLFEVVQK